MPPIQWPSSRDYVEAVQNPRTCFIDPDLQNAACALDRLGMPFVTSGQFAYVFKMNHPSNGTAQAVRCFRSELGDREQRYRKISEHLDKVTAPYFPDFEYDSQGMTVAGRKLPILTMEWVSGHPLDVYLGKVLRHSDVITSLAEFWLRALQMMQGAKMAHGDLQHGNIIVDPSNNFRLVDLDGMYVPEMAGLKAAELGHRHYQHPKRSHDQFDEKLDNFSGLVIYISLLAIASNPTLWDKFHDDNNLIFKQPDFEAPKSSPLFQALKKIGEIKSLTEVLEKACSDKPASCPSVLEFVKLSATKLPSWMLNAPTISVDQSNREAKPGALGSSSIPITHTTAPPASSNLWGQSAAGAAISQPIYGTPTASTPPSTGIAAKQSTFNPHSKRFGLNYALILAMFVWAWHPMLRAMFPGAMTGDFLIWEAAAFVGCSYYLGHNKAKKMGLLLAKTTPTPQQVKQPSASRPQYQIPIVNVPAPTAAPVSKAAAAGRAKAHTSSPPSYAVTANQTAATGQICVASRIRSVFHKPTCKWAQKISYRNRLQYNSAAEARSRGLKPCGICNP